MEETKREHEPGLRTHAKIAPSLGEAKARGRWQSETALGARDQNAVGSKSSFVHVKSRVPIEDVEHYSPENDRVASFEDFPELRELENERVGAQHWSIYPPCTSDRASAARTSQHGRIVGFPWLGVLRCVKSLHGV